MSPNPETRSEPVKDIQSAAAERVKQRPSANRPATTMPNTASSQSGKSSAGAMSANSNSTSDRDSAKSTEDRSDERCQLIAERAYFLAEQRQFIGGDPIADWLQAEREIDRRSEDSPPVDSPR